jgi:CheY-like chemotaxis protein
MSNQFILYIEDDPVQLELVQKLLEHELPGVIVDVCCTARGAESFLNHRCYDVIVCDVDLPGELGTDIAAKILERDPGQPIHLMSEYTGHKVKEAAARIGLTLQRKFVDKDPQEFVEDVKLLLTKRPCDSSIVNLPGAMGETAVVGPDPAPAIAELGEAAATRENHNHHFCSVGNCGLRNSHSDVRHGNSAEQRSNRPLKSIRLTHPYVMAARASLA